MRVTCDECPASYDPEGPPTERTHCGACGNCVDHCVAEGVTMTYSEEVTSTALMRGWNQEEHAHALADGDLDRIGLTNPYNELTEAEVERLDAEMVQA